MKKNPRFLISLLVFALITFVLWWLFDVIKPILGVGTCDCLPTGVVCTACPVTVFDTFYVFGTFALSPTIALVGSIFLYHKLGGKK